MVKMYIVQLVVRYHILMITVFILRINHIFKLKIIHSQ